MELNANANNTTDCSLSKRKRQDNNDENIEPPIPILNVVNPSVRPFSSLSFARALIHTCSRTLLSSSPASFASSPASVSAFPCSLSASSASSGSPCASSSFVWPALVEHALNCTVSPGSCIAPFERCGEMRAAIQFFATMSDARCAALVSSTVWAPCANAMHVLRERARRLHPRVLGTVTLSTHLQLSARLVAMAAPAQPSLARLVSMAASLSNIVFHVRITRAPNPLLTDEDSEIVETYDEDACIATAAADLLAQAPATGGACDVCLRGALHYKIHTMYCVQCRKRILPTSCWYRTKDAYCIVCEACAMAQRKDSSKRQGRPWGRDNKLVFFKDLLLVKHSVPAQENWVRCACGSWAHSVCALHSSLWSVAYVCWRCAVAVAPSLVPAFPPAPSPDFSPAPAPASAFPPASSGIHYTGGAAELPRTRLSDAVDTRIRKKLHEHASSICVFSRIVSVTDRTFFTPPATLELFAEHLPSQIEYRAKTLLLFWRNAGIDVVIFAALVYECYDDCYGGDVRYTANARTAYLSYIDSVALLQPASLRSVVFRETLVAYFEHLRDIGFNRLLLWSCPPAPGDDYVLHCHPDTQCMPSAQKLWAWYKQVAQTAVSAGVVHSYLPLADVFFSSPTASALEQCMKTPLFPDDCIVDSMEETSSKSNIVNRRKLVRTSLEGVSQMSQMSQAVAKDARPCLVLPSPSPPQSPTTDSLLSDSLLSSRLRRLSSASDSVSDTASSSSSSRAAFLPTSDAEKNARKIRDCFTQKTSPQYLVLNLRTSCSTCHAFFTTGARAWKCLQCVDPSNVLCNACFDALPPFGPSSLQPATCAEHSHMFASAFGETSIPSRDAVSPIPVVRDKCTLTFSPLFSSRDLLLASCRAHNFQFDSLRHARFSSDMLLWYATHPHVDSLFRSCSACSKTITSNLLLSCRLCVDFYLCLPCHQQQQQQHCNSNSSSSVPPPTGKVHSHACFSATIVKLNELSCVVATDERAAQNTQFCEIFRQQNVVLDLLCAALPHAITCASVTCHVTMCARVRALLQDQERRSVIHALVALHARKCTSQHASCSIAECAGIKHELRNRKSTAAFNDARLRMMAGMAGKGTSALSISTPIPASASASSLPLPSSSPRSRAGINMFYLLNHTASDCAEMQEDLMKITTRLASLCAALSITHGSDAVVVLKRNTETRIRNETRELIRTSSKIGVLEEIPWDVHRELYVMSKTLSAIRQLQLQPATPVSCSADATFASAAVVG